MSETTNKSDKATNEPSENYGRPSSIEDKTNQYFVHPVSNLVVQLSIKLGLAPNLISVLGLLCGFFAAYLYLFLPKTGFVIGAFAAMVCWHIFDGADGKLARATGQASAFGRVIDGICDHLVFGAVYTALAFQMMVSGFPTSIWWLVIGAGLSHALQSASYEERRQKFQRRHSGTQRDAIAEKLLNVEGKQSILAVTYNSLQKFAAGRNSILDEKLQDLANDKKKLTEVVNKTAPMVKLWGLLNANNRTILIFIAAILNQPILYFVIEVTLLNFILIGLIIYEQSFDEKLAHPLDTYKSA